VATAVASCSNHLLSFILAGIVALPASIHIGDPATGADHVRYMTNSDRGHALFASEVNLLCHPYFVNDPEARCFTSGFGAILLQNVCR